MRRCLKLDRDHNILESKTSPEEWQRECERVSTRLKVQMAGDTKEWRTHLEQAKKYGEVSIHSHNVRIESQGVPAGSSQQAGEDLGRAVEAAREDLGQGKGH